MQDSVTSLYRISWKIMYAKFDYNPISNKIARLRNSTSLVQYCIEKDKRKMYGIYDYNPIFNKI